MKALILCLLLSDSTAYKNLGLTAKDARILSENSLSNVNQDIYNNIKAEIYKAAESQKREIIFVVGRKKFSPIYDNKPLH